MENRPKIKRFIGGAAVAICLAGTPGCAAAPQTDPEPANALASETTPARARLVMVGGGLLPGQADVFEAFLSAARDDGVVYIVPAASSEPTRSGLRVRAALLRNGAPPERVLIAPLALIDDAETEEIDEAGWAANARSAFLAERLETAAGIWFTGGDQARIMAALTEEAGAPTPALEAILKAHQAGAPLAGSSAGAAVMSAAMLLGGDTLSALHPASDTDAKPELGRGLGLFKHGLIDQHFSERARFGRLAAALADGGAGVSRGFGIDENTALILDADGGLRVAGSGHVTILDISEARAVRRGAALQIEGLKASFLSAGDAFDPAAGAMTPARWKTATRGREYFETPVPAGAGLALPVETLAAAAARAVVDNSAARRAERVSFADDGRGVRVTLREDEATQGFWGRGEDGAGRYAISGLNVDIAPVWVSVADHPQPGRTATARLGAPDAAASLDGRRAAAVGRR